MVDYAAKNAANPPYKDLPSLSAGTCEGSAPHPALRESPEYSGDPRKKWQDCHF